MLKPVTTDIGSQGSQFHNAQGLAMERVWTQVHVNAWCHADPPCTSCMQAQGTTASILTVTMCPCVHAAAAAGHLVTMQGFVRKAKPGSFFFISDEPAAAGPRLKVTGARRVAAEMACPWFKEGAYVIVVRDDAHADGCLACM